MRVALAGSVNDDPFGAPAATIVVAGDAVSGFLAAQLREGAGRVALAHLPPRERGEVSGRLHACRLRGRQGIEGWAPSLALRAAPCRRCAPEPAAAALLPPPPPCR